VALLRFSQGGQPCTRSLFRLEGPIASPLLFDYQTVDRLKTTPNRRQKVGGDRRGRCCCGKAKSPRPFNLGGPDFDLPPSTCRDWEINVQKCQFPCNMMRRTDGASHGHGAKILIGGLTACAAACVLAFLVKCDIKKEKSKEIQARPKKILSSPTHRPS
jgi:hypothetical protein